MKTVTPKEDRLRLAMDNARKLPMLCYIAIKGIDSVCMLRRGDSGYFKTDVKIDNRSLLEWTVSDMNRKLSVTRAQVAAMEAGSMFGWHTKAADVGNYDAEGRLNIL